MADTNKTIMSVVVSDQATKLSDFAIGDKQLIFAKDKRLIAVDFNGTRSFYNQIETLTTESERQTLETPVEGLFYFVLGTATLWTYNSGWICITTPPQEVIFIGNVLPEIGSENTLYTNKESKEISIWDVETQSYVVVANKMEEISEDDIDAWFN